MGTKRTPLKRGWHQGPPPTVTPEQLALWRRAKTLRRGSDAFQAVEAELQAAIGMSKFGPTPLGGPALLAGGEVNEPLARAWRAALVAAEAAAAPEDDREAG
jgi:hypothetical protein